MVSGAKLGFGSVLKIGDGNVGASVKAFKTWGATTASIRLLASVAGAAGNNRVVEILVSGSSFVKTSITSTICRITCPTTATVAMVCEYLYQDATFKQYWDADYNAVGDGTGTILAQTATVTAGGSDGSETFTTVAEVELQGGPNFTLGTVEVTNLDSTGGYREFIATLKDAGELTFKINWQPTAATHLQLKNDFENKVLRNFKLVFADGSNTTFNCAAFVAGLQISAPMQDALTASVSLKISGQPTWS